MDTDEFVGETSRAERIPMLHLFDMLTRGSQGWIDRCRSTLRSNPEALAGLLDPEGDAARALALGGPAWPEPLAGAGSEAAEDAVLEDEADGPALSAAQAILSVALALVDTRAAETGLWSSIRHWRRAHLVPADGHVSIPRELLLVPDRRLGSVLQRLDDLDAGPAAGYVALLALVLTDTPLRVVRRVDVPVLFDEHVAGGQATLQLSVLEGGPAGLYPDPARMSFLATDDAFAASLAAAWRTSPYRQQPRCITWAIVKKDQPCNDVVRGSLGAAFAVALDELARRTRRLGTFRLKRLDHRCAVTGLVDERGNLQAVAGYENKLDEARRNELRVVAPAASMRELRQLAERHQVQVDLARDVASAIKLTRTRINIRFLVAAVAFLAMAIAATGTSLAIGPRLAQAVSERNAAEQRRTAADLAARAVDFESANPRLAALLALASYRIHPAPNAVAALTRVSEQNSFVSRSIFAHPGGVTALAQDQAGELLYSTGRDGTLRVWDIRSGRQLAEQANDTAVVSQLAHNPKAPLLAGFNSRGAVELWRTDDAPRLGRPTRLATGAGGGREAVALGFFSEGNRLFAAFDDGRIQAWDVVSHDVLLDNSLQAMMGDRDRKAASRIPRVVAASVTADESSLEPGSSILVATDDRRIFSVDLKRQHASLVLDSPDLPGDLSGLAIKPNSKGQVIAISTTRGVVLWDNARNQRIAYPVGGVGGSVTHAAFNSDGSVLAIATDRGMALVDLEDTTFGSGVAPGLSQPHGGPVDAFASTLAVGGRVAAGHPDGSIAIFDPGNRRLAQPPAPGSTVLSFDARGQLLLTDSTTSTGTRTTKLYLIRPASGTVRNAQTDTDEYRRLRTFEPDPAWWQTGNTFFVNEAVLTEDLVVAAGQDAARAGVVLVWDARTGKPLQRLPFAGGDPDLVTSVRIVPGLDAVVARNSAGELAAWSTSDWRQLFRITVGGGGGLEIQPHSSTAVLPVLADDSGVRPNQTTGTLAFVDLRTQAVRRVAVPAPVYRAVFSPDGATIATLAEDQKLRLLTPDGQLQLGTTPLELPNLASNLAFSPNGSRLAIAMLDGRTLVYETASRTLAMPPLQDVDGYQAVDLAWDPEGRLLAVSSMRRDQRRKQTGRVNFWSIGAISWQSQVCSLVNRDVTREEWAQYVGDSVPFTPLCAGVERR